MNAMVEALKTAGVKIPPLNKRAWLWLKDHPNKTYAEIAAGIGGDAQKLASAMNYLKMANAVTVKGDVRTINGRVRKIQRFSTVGAEYDPDTTRAQRIKREVRECNLAKKAAQASTKVLASKPDEAKLPSNVPRIGPESLYATLGSTKTETTGAVSPLALLRTQQESPLVKQDEAAPNAIKNEPIDWMDRLTLREGLQLYRRIKQIIEL